MAEVARLTSERDAALNEGRGLLAQRETWKGIALKHEHEHIRLLLAGQTFVEAMQGLHCPECSFAWNDLSPNAAGDERCEDCEAQHAAVVAAQLVFLFRPASDNATNGKPVNANCEHGKPANWCCGVPR